MADETKATLNSRSYREKTRPRKASSTCRWTRVSTQILTPWADRPRKNAATTTAGRGYRAAGKISTTAATASRATIQARGVSRDVASGVTTAAAKYPRPAPSTAIDSAAKAASLSPGSKV